ncbi:MAG: penicillin-binding protein 1C [Archangium sp.]|nr:penicillin-binding protein 1C [Archangium sp.]
MKARVGERARRLLTLLLLAVTLIAGLELWIRTHPWSRDALTTPPQSLRMLDRNGVLLRESVNDEGERSRWVPLAEVSPALLQATLAAEDDRFHSHSGVDPKSVARAVVQDLRARRIVSGASTLTMQLARRLEPHSRSALGKLKEMIDARRIELTLSKNEILEQYVNRVPYGAGAIGIEAAAQRYFGKPATHLSLAEAAMLAGLPKGPTGLNPLKNPVGAKERQQYVLDRLLITGRAGAEDIERARREPLSFASLEAPSAMHFTEWVRLSDNPDPKTTLDAELQREVEDMVSAHVATLSSQGVTNTAVVVLDNERCEVLSMVGSADYWHPRDGSVNGALAKRQPGSTLKPFTYALAYEQGRSPASVAADVETRYGEVGGALFQPQNFSRDFSGPVLFHEALGRSLNVPAIRVAALFGTEELLSTLHRAGFASLDKPASHYGLGLTLGNGEVTLLELAQGYAMFARGGRSCTATSSRSPFVPSEVEGRAPRLAGSRPSTSLGVNGAVFSPQTAYLVTSALSDEATRMRAFGPGNALMLSFPVAVKTGTSTNWRDNWAVGYTQKYTVAVWAGDFDNRPMDSLAGASGAGPLFNRVMTRVALRGGQPKPVAFTAPPEVVEVSVCATSGQRPTADCPERRGLSLPKGQLPAHECEHHRQLRLDARNGLLAGASCPPQFVTQRAFEVLPSQYAQWQLEHPRRAPPARYSPLCPRTGPAAGAVVITWPRQGEVFVIEPGYSRRTQSVALTAEADLGQAEVRWLMDGQQVAIASIAERPLWALAPGRHSLEAEVRGRRSAAVTFEVR